MFRLLRRSWTYGPAYSWHAISHTQQIHSCWLLHNLDEANFDLFRYLLLGDQLKPWELHPLVSYTSCMNLNLLWYYTHASAQYLSRSKLALACLCVAIHSCSVEAPRLSVGHHLIITLNTLRFMQLVYDTSGCSSQGFSWSPNNRYLDKSKLASTRLCNNHIIIYECASFRNLEGQHGHYYILMTNTLVRTNSSVNPDILSSVATRLLGSTGYRVNLRWCAVLRYSTAVGLLFWDCCFVY